MKRKDVEDYLTPQEQAWLRHYRTMLNEARKAVQHEQARVRKLLKNAHDRRLREEHRNERT